MNVLLTTRKDEGPRQSKLDTDRMQGKPYTLEF